MIALTYYPSQLDTFCSKIRLIFITMHNSQIVSTQDLITVADLQETYELNFKKYFGYAYSLTSNVENAKDIAHSVFADLYLKIKSKGSIKIENLESYLIRSIRNEFIDRNSKELRKSKTIENLIGIQTDELDVNIVKEDRINILTEAIQHLSTAQRTCLVMYYFDKLKVSAIAQDINISESAVKTHIQRARENLKKAIVKSGGNSNE